MATSEDFASADNQHSEPLHTWESPDWSMLDERRPGDLPDFPGNELGKAFATVNRAAKGAGVTLDHVAVPLLGIASGLIGVARRVQASTSWLEPCTIWCAIVGYSGDGKTPGLDVTKRVLAAVEREKRDAVLVLQRRHDSKVEAARVRLAAAKLAAVTDTLAVAEGVETALAANMLGHGPAWALGSAGAVASLPVLHGIERLILLQENNDASRDALDRCGRRWMRAGRKVIRVRPDEGCDDLNDELIAKGIV